MPRITAWNVVWRPGDRMNVRWNNEMVQNPYLAAVLVMWATFWIVLVFTIITLTLPVWVPLDIILQLAGLKGFYRGDALIFELASFMRR